MVTRSPLPPTRLAGPPPAESAWPWGEMPCPEPESPAVDTLLPKITIVTPSFNQVQYLEETLRSVLLQGYPNLEYIVIDGGSSDSSVEILHKYADRIDYWMSEPDSGQTHALNKGFARATGDWLMWLNSDDLLLPGALWAIADAIRLHPGSVWVVGNVVVVDEELQPIRRFEPVCTTDDWTDFLCNKRKSGTSLPQPGSCWSRQAWLDAGPLDETLRYVMDYEYWARLARCGYRPLLLNRDLAMFRLSAGSKSGSGMKKFIREEKAVVATYLREGKVARRLSVYLYLLFLNELRWYRLAAGRAKSLLHKCVRHA